MPNSSSQKSNLIKNALKVAYESIPICLEHPALSGSTQVRLTASTCKASHPDVSASSLDTRGHIPSPASTHKRTSIRLYPRRAHKNFTTVPYSSKPGAERIALLMASSITRFGGSFTPKIGPLTLTSTEFPFRRLLCCQAVSQLQALLRQEAPKSAFTIPPTCTGTIDAKRVTSPVAGAPPCGERCGTRSATIR